MSQASKVLHLYVEVRSASEEDEKPLGRGDDGMMLQCPDILTNSQRSSAHSSPNRSPDVSPMMSRRSGNGNCNLPSSKSSSRHSVSFQIQNSDPTGSPTQFQDVLNDSFGQLFKGLTQKTSNLDSLGHNCSPDADSFHRKMPTPQLSPSCGLLTVPSPSNCRSYEDQEMDMNGMTSVVSFGYIDKASVNSMAGHRNSMCLKENKNRLEGQLVHAPLQKRTSDSVWYNVNPASDDTFHRHSEQSRSDTPKSSPYLSRATMDAVARDATHRALEEFGSPKLRHRFAGHNSENCSTTLLRHHQSPHCQSWGGSSTSSRSTLTLPSKTKLNGLPRSPASDHLCAQVENSFHSSVSTPHTHDPTQSLRRQWVSEEHSMFPNQFHLPLPAGRPTDIQHEIPTVTFHTSNPSRSDYSHHSVDKMTNTSHQAAKRVSYSSNEYLNTQSPCYSSRCSSRVSDADSFVNDSRSISPSSNSELDCKLSGESNKLSIFSPDNRTPSPTPSQAESMRSVSPKSFGPFPKESLWQSSLNSLRMDSQDHNEKTKKRIPTVGQISPLSQESVSTPSSPALEAKLHHASASQSPVLDHLQKLSSIPIKDRSDLHHYQLPRCTGLLKSPGLERKHYDRLFDGSSRSSPEVTRRHTSCQNSEGLTVSWTSRQQEWKDAGSVQDTGKTYEENHHRKSSGVYTPSKEEHCKRDARDKGVQPPPAQEYQIFRDQSEARDHSASKGTSSQNSSGVTGSLGDGFQPDRNGSLSPETSSSTSHGTADSSSGMKSENGSSLTPSLRSQKIAQAKWDFLFGDQTKVRCCSKDVLSTPPPPSGSPSPTSPSPLHLRPAHPKRGRDRQGQKLSHHEVRQIEVELVAPLPRDPTPKTGIIRRSIKYSETDLDAVPLRCYRETNLDEVMRAEAEAAAEADSIFGRNRIVLENSFTPEKTSPTAQTGRGREENGEKGKEEEDEDDDDEEEEVVSWASVRMLGDRQRQRATKEGDEVFSLLLKGTLEASSDAHGGLKSPVSIGSPRRPSDNNLDSFSRHFESIMESHRAKGTSYSSLDSVDLLTSGSTSVFTFDLPTLTPEIQSQICESAKQIIELTFAPLSRPGPFTHSETSRSEITLTTPGSGLRGGFKDDPSPSARSRLEKEPWRGSILQEGFRKATSVPSLNSTTRERSVIQLPELLYPQTDVAERLAFGGSDDALTNGLKPDLQAAKRLAKRLYNLDGFKKSDVARNLSRNNNFSQLVAQEYLSYFNFTGLTIDQALRSFLMQFALMGETQERERVLAHFSQRYRQCNPETLSTEDGVHTLTCAIMLLNTDLHGNNVGKRMSCSQFISNLEGLNDGKDFPKDLLKTLYSSIKNEKLQWTIDEEELRKSVSELAEVRTDSASHTMKRLGSGGNPLVGVAQQADRVLYKSGFLVRKVHADPDGKRTPKGKRGWKTFYAVLKGLVLYLQKDEYRSEQELSEEDVKNAVSIHHSLAMRAADYSKRPNVFYLRTADWRVFLFQAQNPEQMQSWITRINMVAAIFSAPPFPAAVGSQKRFSRPLLPGSNTKLSQEEQLKSHENRFRAVSSELVELTASTPDRKMKGREMEDQKLRKEYLEFEKTRYGTYAMLLRAKVASGDEDLSTFESRLFKDGGLQRAHSSPSLPQDAANKEKTRGTKTSKSLKVTSFPSLTSKSDSGVKDEVKKKSDGENNQRVELQKQSNKQTETE